ncbi:MAG: gamma-glutamyl-gamma-aminobutyrate hydrolase family protein [Syntrophomonadaceae bacterium]
MRPVIGICCNYETQEAEHFLKDFYVDSLLRAGGTVVLLPPVEDVNIAKQYLKLCHGFVLPGGGDIDPYYWGELPQRDLGEINPRRDSFELIMAKLLIDRDLPTLGICRGCQVINVAAGGTLIQDIESSLAHQQKAPRNYPFHKVAIKSETLLSRILNTTEARVNSFHHQAVAQPGYGMQVSALAPDGIIEAIEGIEAYFFLGVQWHPECMQDSVSSQLFKAFIQAAKSRGC